MTATRRSRVALMMMVRDEERLLRQNILYHKYLGIERFYVFLDLTVDGTASSVSDLEFVQLAPSVADDRFLQSTRLEREARSLPGLRDAFSQAREHFAARQILSAFAALQDAREAGFEWLAVIDADELLGAGSQKSEAGDLSVLLGEMDPKIEQVRFLPSEVVPSRQDLSYPFTDARLFKTLHFRLQRRAYDPLRGRHVSLPAWQGHRKGKCAVRLTVDAYPLAHEFYGFPRRNLKTRSTGVLYHYQLCDFPAFLKWARHNRNHPDRFVSGHPVPLAKRLWRDVVNDAGLSEDELRQYYDSWIVLEPAVLEAARRKGRGWGPLHGRPWLLHVDSVAEVFEKLGDNESRAISRHR